VSLTLHESAALVGGHCWIERRLFARLGAWSQQDETPAVKLLLDRHAQHAAWRAEQWWERLPVLAQVDREELVTAPEGWGQLLAADRDEVVAPGRVAVAYRVLFPRLSTRYGRHAARTAPVADGPVVRTLGQADADVRADWAEGERLVEDLLADRVAIENATAAIAAAELDFLG
jgi:hypothetical protein